MADGEEDSSSSHELFVAQKETADKLPKKSEPPSVVQPLEIDLGAHKHSEATNNSHTYNKVNQMSPRIMDKTSTLQDDIPCKVYGVVCYRIMLHVLLLYAVIGVSYLLFVQEKSSPFYANSESRTQSTVVALTNTNHPTENPTIYPSIRPTSGPTMSPTIYPSKAPTAHPTSNPTFDPSSVPTTAPSVNPTHNPTNILTIDPTREPTTEPSEYPSTEPTIEPTNDPTTIATNIPNHYIGDYKISAQNSSHGHWLLCDGSFIDKNIYSELFDVVGYSFDASLANTSLFKLPNPLNKVIGIHGESHSMGDTIGNETIILSEEQLPNHSHFIASDSDCEQSIYGQTLENIGGYPYLAWRCVYPNNFHNNYMLQTNVGVPNTFETSNTGNSHSLNVIQPTVYIGNLFIYTGRTTYSNKL